MKEVLGLIVAALFLATGLYAADARVTDSTGVEVLVKDIGIDYGGLLGSDNETDGVRVSQGEALVTAMWADIESLTVTGRDPDAREMTVSIHLRNGKTIEATLVRKGRMKLTGKADLGDYSIDLEKVQKITIVSAK